MNTKYSSSQGGLHNSASVFISLPLSLTHTHTHTQNHIYIYRETAQTTVSVFRGLAKMITVVFFVCLFFLKIRLFSFIMTFTMCTCMDVLPSSNLRVIFP